MSDSRASTLRALLFASSAAGMLCAAPAFAAEEGPIATAPEAGPVIPADQDTARVGDVNVDGQRTRRQPTSPRYVAPLLDTPRAVTVIPQEIIEQTGATSLMDILRTSPGISFGAGEGGQPLADRPFIRGQSSGNNIFVDGIRDTGSQQREVFDLEQVEVIKGPDSVYSGRGSGGGSINLGSKQPKTVDFTNVSLGLGSDSYVRGTIDQNWSLGENAGLRVNLMGNSGDIAGRGPVDYDKWGLAVAVGAGIGTDTTGTFSYYHLTSDQLPDYGVPLFTKLVRAATATTAPVFTRPDASGVLNVPFDTFYGLKARDYLTTTADTFTAAFMHRFSDNLILRNTSRYSHTLNDYIVTNPADGGYVGYDAATSTYWMKRGTKTRWNPADTYANVTDLSGSFLTGSIKHSFDVGLELTREINRNAAYSTYTTSGAACPTGLILVNGAAPTASGALGAGDCTRVYDPNPDDAWTGVINRGPASSVTTETVGVYGFDSITLTDKFIINLGLRWDSYSASGVTKNGTQVNGVWTLNAPDAATPGLVIVPERTWEFTNYQIGAVYKPTPATSLYASFATSSTPPTISAGDQNTAGGTGTGNLATTVLDPEDTESFEVGAKANIFNNRLALSAAAFHLTRKNAAILVDVGVYEQAGEVEVQGIELGISGSITPNWQVFGGYTYMDSELVRGAVTATGGTNVNQGDRLGNTPEHSASLFTTYRIIPRLSIGGGVYYVGDNFAGNAQGAAGGGANKIFTPAYTRLDLFASYDLTPRATLQLNVQNANDEEYYIRNNGTHHADPAPGRSATLALNVSF
ncbi:MAG: TonB-dependent receptor [Caulobacteraceae bacterium]|nr:TonB-dependent receptor [Caulobacteraceae bacterium]